MAYGVSDGRGHAEGIAGGIGAGGAGVVFSNVGGTWSTSGGKAINTPSLGSEAQTDGGLEGAYTSGRNNTLIAQFSQTDVENTTDQRSGSKCQQFTGAPSVSNASLYQNQSVLTLTTGTWYRMAYWSKRTAGSAGNVGSTWNLIGLAPSSNIPGAGITSTTYTEYSRVSRCVNGASFKIDLFVSNSTGSPDTVVLDDISVMPLALNELLSVSDLAIADVMIGSNIAVSGAATSIANPVGFALNVDSSTNPQNFVLVYLALITNSSNYKIYVEKCVGGAYTTVSSTTFTYSAGARLVVQKSGTEYRVYYNNALVTAQTISDAGIVNNTLHGLFSTDASNTLDDLTIYAIGSNGEYAALDAWSS